MQVLIAILGAAVCLANTDIPTAKPEEVGLDSTRLQVLDDYLRHFVSPGDGQVQQLAGTIMAVARDRKLVHFTVDGDQVLGKVPMAEDTIFRFYSMSKPITAVTLMTFWEQARFHLDDPVSMYLPAFKDMRVLRTPTSTFDDTVPAERPITIRHLLTHTSGLSYGWEENSVDRYYRDNGVDIFWENVTLADFAEKIAKAPLLFQPGEHWHYSLSIDVCGALIEALAGDTFSNVLQARVLDPLGMSDTGFFVPEGKRGRFSPNYFPPTDDNPLEDAHDPTGLTKPLGASGGGGLCGTTKDYLRFGLMLANHGEFGGKRVLAPRTVRLLTSNNVDGGVSLKTLGTFPGDQWSKGGFSGGVGKVEFWGGVGQALGGQVILDPVASDMASGKGMYYWGGAAGTLFHVDFEERMVAVYMQQRTDGGPKEMQGYMRTLVQAAILDEPRAAHLEV